MGANMVRRLKRSHLQPCILRGEAYSQVNLLSAMRFPFGGQNEKPGKP